jgi:glutathione S-transferase
MKLYSLTLSPNGRKAQSIIAYLGFDAEIIETNMAAGQHKSPEFLAMNPMGKIPTLDDDGFYVWESNTILNYLAGQRPESNLIPTDLKQRTEVDKWMHWQSGHYAVELMKVVVELVLKPMYKMGPADQAVVQGALEQIKGFTGILEKQLAGKEFLCGSLSVADFSIAPWAEIVPQMGLDYADFPNVRAWVERCTALKGWVPTPQMVG